MPIYEYYCEKCHEEFEVIQKFTDDPLVHCPSCDTDSLKKKTSMAAFHLKGGGWYKDGYGNGNGGSKNDTGTLKAAKSEKSITSTKSTADKNSKDNKDSKKTSSVSAPKSKAS